jgi:hypothetical protein
MLDRRVAPLRDRARGGPFAPFLLRRSSRLHAVPVHRGQQIRPELFRRDYAPAVHNPQHPDERFRSGFLGFLPRRRDGLRETPGRLDMTLVEDVKRFLVAGRSIASQVGVSSQASGLRRVSSWAHGDLG